MMTSQTFAKTAGKKMVAKPKVKKIINALKIARGEKLRKQGAIVWSRV